MFLLSKRFWLAHKRRAFAIICSYMLCAMAVVSACLYFRGLKITEAWENYKGAGYCDMCFYDLSQEQLDYLKEDERFQDFGTMVRAGYAQGEIGENFVVGSLTDEQSINMFYIPPEEGNYPSSKGEIIIDRNYLAYMGVRPEVGTEITLFFHDFEGNELSTRNFRVSGIIEMEYFTSAGFSVERRQYPNRMQGEYDYSSPMAFLYWEDYREIFQEAATPQKYHTVTYADLDYTMLGEQDDYDIFIELSMETPMFKGVTMKGGLRSSNANSVLGYQVLTRDVNTWGFNAVSERISNGTKQPDFYSGILLPCYMCVLFVITMVSTTCLFKAMLAHRREHIRSYHTIGMSWRDICIMLIGELAVMAVIGLIVGLLGGVLLYLGVYCLLNSMGAGLHSAFEYNAFVNAVTFNPFLSSAIIVIIAYFGSVPMLQKELNQKQKSALPQADIETNGYYRLLFTREKQMYGYQGVAATMIICVLVVSFVAGYLVYCTDTENKNNDNYNIMTITDYPYTAMKGTADYGLFENLHNEGISPEDLEKLIRNDMVEDYYAKMLNMSTKLSYSNIPDNREVIEALASLETEITAKVRYGIEETDGYTKLLAERSDSTLEKIGYDTSEVLFAAPTVGLPQEKILELDAYVTAGNIDVEKLRKGEQVLFVIPEGKVLPVKVGDVLPLTDVLLHEKAENSERLNISSEAPEWAEIIRVDEWNGEDWPLYDIGGVRIDIPVRIGAIVELPQEVMEKYYCETLGAYKVNFNLTTVGEAFEVWEVPDRKYTEIGVKPIDGFDRELFETFWYQMIGASNDVSSVSQNGVYESMEQTAVEQMRIYLALCVMLAVIGGIGFVNAIVLRAEQMLPKMKQLSRLGADERMIYRYMLWINLRVLPLVFGIGLTTIALFYGMASVYTKYLNKTVAESKVGEFVMIWLASGRSNYHPIVVVLLLVVVIGVVITFAVSNVYLSRFRKNHMPKIREVDYA